MTGKKNGGPRKAQFLKNVDTVYVPMNWGGTHWVGLVIDMVNRHVEVLDPFIAHNNEAETAAYMNPIVVCFPWILKSTSPPVQVGGFDTTPYTWLRTTGIYQNERSGDCGPVAAKFLEIRAAGLGVKEMAQITDKDVDRFREKYAMDCYEAFVLEL